MSPTDSNTAAAQLMDLWKRQIEEGTAAWARMMVGSAAVPTGLGPAAFWRPLMDQGIAAWSQILSQTPASPELLAQWKQFVDQWIDAWSKAMGQAMGTEPFAQALGQYLDQWLAVQGPAKKATEQALETTFATLGLPTRGQVTAVARQLVELEERLERLEDSVRAVLDRLPGRSANDRKDDRRPPRR